MKSALLKLYKLTFLGSYLQSPLLLFFRLFFGFGFFQAGYGKLQNIPHFQEYLSTLSIPFPTFNAYFVAGVETLGGLLLIVGFLSRLISIPLVANMVVAYLTADFEAAKALFSKPDMFFAAAPFLFLLTALLVLAFGPGKFSLDYLIARKDNI